MQNKCVLFFAMNVILATTLALSSNAQSVKDLNTRDIENGVLNTELLEKFKNGKNMTQIQKQKMKNTLLANAFHAKYVYRNRPVLVARIPEGTIFQVDDVQIFQYDRDGKQMSAFSINVSIPISGVDGLKCMFGCPWTEKPNQDQNFVTDLHNKVFGRAYAYGDDDYRIVIPFSLETMTEVMCWGKGTLLESDSWFTVWLGTDDDIGPTGEIYRTPEEFSSSMTVNH